MQTPALISTACGPACRSGCGLCFVLRADDYGGLPGALPWPCVCSARACAESEDGAVVCAATLDSHPGCV